MGLLGKSSSSAVVGLDIGSELIKVAEAKRVKNNIQITGLGVAPTPPGAIEDSIVVDPQSLGAAVKRLLRESGIKTKHVVSAVSGPSSVVVRVIEVPKMTREELAETMKWEVERHVPFSPTEIVMDFAPIEKPGTPPDAQNMEVLLAVAQQDAINTHIKVLFAAGLEPTAIDVQPLAVSRALIDVGNGGLPQTVAVINIGATTTDVGVFEGGILTFPGPPLPIAGINLTRAISEALGVPMEEAERLKKEYAAVDLSGVATGALDAGFDVSAPAADEPTAFDTAYAQADDQQPDSDASPFDFGAAEAPEPEPEEKKFDISGEEVFDLGGGEEPTQFKPMFDLEEPDAEAAETGQGFALGAEGHEGTPAADAWQSPAVPDAAEPGAEPVMSGYDVRQGVMSAIAPVLAELAVEIRRSLDYYTTRYQNRPEQIFLCGGTAKMRDLDRFLEGELGVPVRVADPVANLTVNCPKYSPQYLGEVSALFPVSIGLAIREMLE